MAQRKVDQSASPTTDRTTTGILKRLKLTLAEYIMAYPKTKDEFAKNKILVDALKAYSDVMDNLKQHYKVKNDEIERLKEDVRGQIQYFKDIVNSDFPMLLIDQIPLNADDKMKHQLAEQEREKIKRAREEQVARESEERQRKESEERQRKESEERQRKESEERQRKESEERQRKESEERQRKESEERQRKESEERQRKETEERQRKESEERQRKEREERQRKEGLERQNRDRLERVRQQQLEQRSNDLIKPIDEAINTLKENLKKPEAGYNSRKTEAVVKSILKEINDARTNYSSELINGAAGDLQRENSAMNSFKIACHSAINRDDRKAVLNNDITWGEYFKDFLKMIYNTLVAHTPNVFTQGRYSFYTYAKAETAGSVESFERDLGTDILTI
jgi:hypothetical protein